MKKKWMLLMILFSLGVVQAQFVNGIGIFGAGMASRHKYKDSNTPERYGSHKGKFIFRPAGGVVFDFFSNENAKWRSEFEYNTMGSREIVTTDGVEKKFKNKLDYISWNNLLKIQGEIFSGFPYGMIGLRTQYLFRNNPEFYQPVMNDLARFHFSWNIAAGFEFMAYGPLRFFSEYHLVSDIPSLYSKENLKVRNLTHELRVGLMYRFQKRAENCNSPIYNDNY